MVSEKCKVPGVYLRKEIIYVNGLIEKSTTWNENRTIKNQSTKLIKPNPVYSPVDSPPVYTN